MFKNKSRTCDCLKQIFALAIVLGLSGCKGQGSASAILETLDPNYYDQSWLTGKPSAAPCWYGLEPGVSTRQASINRVEQLPFVDKSSINITNHLDFGFVEESFLFKRSQGSGGGLGMIFKPDVLDSVGFSPNYRIYFRKERVIDAHLKRLIELAEERFAQGLVQQAGDNDGLANHS